MTMPRGRRPWRQSKKPVQALLVPDDRERLDRLSADLGLSYNQVLIRALRMLFDAVMTTKPTQSVDQAK